jgi:phosphoribosylamine--glycine ligase
MGVRRPLLKVLIIGGGGREHALAWKIRQSPRVKELFVAPGNAGTASIAQNLNVKATEIEALLKAAQQYKIDFTVVGPEAPLAEGIVDLFESHGLRVFGPTKAAAKLETSKVFAKRLMQKFRIPTAPWAAFFNARDAREYVRRQELPLVIKADGLAAGKGVMVVKSKEEALEAIRQIMQSKIFGQAGERIVVEKCLVGREVSLLAFTDGAAVLPMVPACDYKRALDGDQGLNTGGMGGYSPPQFFDDRLIDQVKKAVLEPAVRGMAGEGSPYKGVLYAGLMLTDDGPRALEFNVRFGDPETQVILPRMKSDLLALLEASVEGKLGRAVIDWSGDACVGVVLTSAGYPGSYETGFPIHGLDRVDSDVFVFHAGTAVKQDSGEIVTDGGRVLTVVQRGETLAEARSRVYSHIPQIDFTGCYYRRDIAAEEE